WKHNVDLIIDAGFGGNQASTIIDLSKDEPIVVREGKGSLDILL
ncbi:MAG: threonylcarbamoyl-AMP synthase, partial [Flavobacteriaceae bacterium]|nr:threonylcarbamoyl-AMP synthase [Flavobacteriaceae bacterium]